MASDATCEELQEFVRTLNQAIADVRKKWRDLDTIDVSQYMIAVLPLRNLDVFEGFWMVVKGHSVPVADMLLRPLLEGTVILEWCALDLPNRALRFRRTSFESTLELIEMGLTEETPEYIKNLRESVAWLEAQGHRRLPNLRQLINDIELFTAAAGYPTYKLFSKSVHALLESWQDFADAEGVASAADRNWSDTPRFRHTGSIAAFLGMRNILLLGTIVPEVATALLPALEQQWARLYQFFELEGSQGEQRP